jgi:hypothetical protein
MEPQTLIDHAITPGLPAPLWFIELFKVLGFTLHAVPMNLWYAGTITAMILYIAGSEHGRRFSHRLMVQMPVIIAFGVNFGIVPLLFIQVAYSKLFYPATVLMAWFWFAIVLLLIPAYYGVYFYAFGLKDPQAPLASLRRLGGWAAALLFISIGFLFVNGMSLMTNVAGWPDLFRQHNVAGAATGTALNVADPTLWPRWLMLFGLAITTTGVWIAFDAAWFGRDEKPQYRQWAPRFAWKLYSLGLVWFAAAGSWYVFGTWESNVKDVMFAWPTVVLTAATALAPGLPWLLLAKASRGGEITRPMASLVGLAQFGVLGINAVSRQIVQNTELNPYYALSQQPVEPQWGSIALFLSAFVVGVLLVVWMIAQVAKTRPTQTV